MKALRLAAWLLFITLTFVGCGSTSGVDSVTEAPPSPQGVVQARTLPDGTLHIAVGIAPHGQGYEGPDLSGIQGERIFDVVDGANGIRARLKDDRSNLDVVAGEQSAYVTDWLMRTERRGIEFFRGERKGGLTNQQPGKPIFGAYTSDGYLVYNAHVSSADQVISITNGTIVGTARVRISEVTNPTFPDQQMSFVEVSQNDGPFLPIPQDQPPPLSILRVKLSVVLPLECASEDPAGAGNWTMDAVPPLRASLAEPDSLIGGTPFQWHVRGLVIDNITVENKPKYVDPTTGEEFHGGATYTARARMVPGDEGAVPSDVFGVGETGQENGRLYLRARVLAGPEHLQREIFVDAGEFSPAGTEITFDWEGTNFGNGRFPVDEKYPIRLWGVIDTDGLGTPGDPEVNPITTAAGRVATPYEVRGPKELLPETALFKATPTPYIPAPLDIDGDQLWAKQGDDYFPLWPHPITGDAWWPPVAPDEDGDGVPDAFNFHPTVWVDGEEIQVDEDGDGFPDHGPQKPEPFKIQGTLFDPERQKLNEFDPEWTLHVRKEPKGAEVHPKFTGTSHILNKEISYEDMVAIIEEHEVDELHLEFHMKLCSKNVRKLFFSARTVDDLPKPSTTCLDPTEATYVADIGASTPVTLAVLDKNGTVVARTRPNGSQALGLEEITDLGELEVRAFGLPEEVSSLSVSISSKPSFLERKPLILKRQSGNSFLDGKFDPSSIIESTGDQQRPVFSSIDWSTGIAPQGETQFFLLEMAERDSVFNGRVFFGADPFDVLNLGDIVDAFSQLALSNRDKLDLSTVGKAAFDAGGFELLQIKIDDSEVESNDRVLLRIANTANVLMMGGHGSYVGFTNTGTSNIVLADRTGPNPPNTFFSEEWRNIKTLIITGCVACNFNDYALNSKKHLTNASGEFFEKIPQSSPARTLKNLIHPNGIILGYQDAAPESPADVPPLNAFSS